MMSGQLKALLAVLAVALATKTETRSGSSCGASRTLSRRAQETSSPADLGAFLADWAARVVSAAFSVG